MAAYESPLDYMSAKFAGPRTFGVLGVLAALVLAGLAAAHYMDVNGHWVTGMNHHVVWGLPHVFAVGLIITASGAVNVASMASVFGQHIYKPYSRLSGVLAICLLAGGLAILVLDLGRPDRLIVAMTEYNFSSIFAWNVFLYVGFAGLVAVYVWLSMERRLNHLSRSAGLVVFVWRFVLTTGTGCIFGFLVAREAYDAAILAPTFIAASLCLGTAVFLLVSLALLPQLGTRISSEVCVRLGRLMAIFLAANLYLAIVYHLTNGYAAQHDGWQLFALSDGRGYTTAFWVGQVLFGAIVPMGIIWSPLGREVMGTAVASTLVVLGGLCQLYVIIIAGQAYPMDLVPGWEIVRSDWMDGQVAPYAPSFPELLLGLGGVAMALLLVAIASRVLAILPVGREVAEGPQSSVS
ncbi:MAG: NrfD/PsrC family molybdoenzyme membrane anchor subunit [Gammaproteobacteria bacterium]